MMKNILMKMKNMMKKILIKKKMDKKLNHNFLKDYYYRKINFFFKAKLKIIFNYLIIIYNF